MSDDQWAEIEDCFPQRKGRRGFAAKVPNRKAFEAVLYRERTGCPWRDLPEVYGFWHTIYMRWQRWVEAGVPQRAIIARHLERVKRGEIDQSLALLDSTIVRAHQHAAGARKKGAIRPLAVRGGLSTKIHAVAINEHEVLGVILSGGEAGDAPAGEEMLEHVIARQEVTAVGADRAYDSDAIRAALGKAGKEAVIPPRSNRLEQHAYDKDKYKERNKIERLFNRLKQFRAVATRYDKLAAMFLGGILAALLAIHLR